MSASFASASSQRLLNSATSLTAYPFTLAGWILPTTIVGTQTVCSITDTAAANQLWAIRRASAQLVFSAQAGGTLVSASLGTFLVANAWHFVVARGISGTNRRISGLTAAGAAVHAQNTTNRIPTGIDTMALGSLESSTPTEFWDGLVGEFWYTNTDIQPDGAQLQDWMLRQLAYGGPFSIPHIAKDIIEYRSLRSDVTGTERDEVYFRDSIPNWTNTNGATLDAHPPLLYQGVETQLIHPYSWRGLWELTKASGGVDTSESRSGTSSGAATNTGRVAVVDEKASTVAAAATVTGKIAVQDAKRSDVAGSASVTGVSDYRNATWEQPGTSQGQATVVGQIAVQDAKQSAVSASASVTATVAVVDEKRATAAAAAAVTGRIAVQDAKRSDVIAGATVTGEATYESSGSEVSVSGTSSAQATVEARIAWMAEIMGNSSGAATVTGESTFEDLSGGTPVTRTNFNPFIASVGRMMGR